MPAFIVAECGVNHLGDRAKMLAFCDAAKACGADAVKFQAYQSEMLALRRGMLRKTPTGLWEALPEHQATYSLLRKASLMDADLDAISAHCKAIGFEWFASVFDPSQVERVLSRGACCLKIGHKEAAWRELFDACHDARPKEKNGAQPMPVWVSGHNVVGVWEYPAVSPPRLGRLRDNNALYRGYSSHFADYRIPAAAALRGAEYIEAHMKLSDTDPEAAWSLSVEDFTKMVKLAKEFESWL